MSSGGYRPAMGTSAVRITTHADMLAANPQNQRRSHLEVGTDFPIVCETCLGPNPYVRMVKLRFGDKLCKVSNAPYPAFRWKAGPQGRFKETIVCREVAIEKNICQACLTDMTFGVPVGVRDALLANGAALDQVGGYVPAKSEANQAFYYQNQKAAITDGVAGGSALAVQQLEPSRELLQLARSIQSANARGGTAFRNLPKLCSFWLGGTCTRVAEKRCPFRPCCGVFKFPELASTHAEVCAALVEELRAQGAHKAMATVSVETRQLLKEAISGNKDDAIRARVLGKDDTSQRYVSRAKAGPGKTPEPPEDATVTSLWVGGFAPGEVTDRDITDAFYAHGEIKSVRVVPSCAFVEFTHRESAEAAMTAKYRNLTIRGQDLALDWAKPKAGGARSSLEDHQQQTGASLPPPGVAVGAPPPALRADLAQALAQWPLGQGQGAPTVAPTIEGPPQHNNDEEPQRKKQKAARGGCSYPSQDPQRLGANK